MAMGLVRLISRRRPSIDAPPIRESGVCMRIRSLAASAATVALSDLQTARGSSLAPIDHTSGALGSSSSSDAARRSRTRRSAARAASRRDTAFTERAHDATAREELENS